MSTTDQSVGTTAAGQPSPDELAEWTAGSFSDFSPQVGLLRD